MARQRSRLKQLGPVIVLFVGVVLFGGLWGLTALATRADKTGPSWRASGLIWLGIGIPISMWSYFGPETIAFVIVPKSHLPARFPTTDFSLVDLVAENGRFTVSLVESEGSKISPVRRVSASEGAKLHIPGQLETMPGELNGLESSLSP